MISPEAILQQLDEAAGRFVFPMLDNGYVYPVEVRMVAYRELSEHALEQLARGRGVVITIGAAMMRACAQRSGAAESRDAGSERRLS